MAASSAQPSLMLNAENDRCEPISNVRPAFMIAQRGPCLQTVNTVVRLSYIASIARSQIRSFRRNSSASSFAFLTNLPLRMVEPSSCIRVIIHPT